MSLPPEETHGETSAAVESTPPPSDSPQQPVTATPAAPLGRIKIGTQRPGSTPVRAQPQFKPLSIRKPGPPAATPAVPPVQVTAGEEGGATALPLYSGGVGGGSSVEPAAAEPP